MGRTVRVAIDRNDELADVEPLLLGQNIEWEHMNHPGLWDGEELATDVVTSLKALGPTSIRFPGGGHGDLYPWRDGIGPRAGRKPMINGFTREHVFPLFGTDELLGLCQAIGAAPWMQTNPISESAESMVEWTRYCEDRGVPIAHWEVGNEVYLADPNQDDGFRSVGIGPAEYVARAGPQVDALRAAVPDAAIGIIGGTWTYENYGWPATSDGWHETVLGALGDRADFLAIHTVYGPIVAAPGFWDDPSEEDVRDTMRSAAAGPLFARRSLDLNIDLVDSLVPGGNLTFAVTEWLPWFGVTPEAADVSGSMGAGLYTAGVLNELLREPRAIAAHFMCGVSASYGGCVVPTEAGVRASVNHAILGMYAQKLGARVVRATVHDAATYSIHAMGVYPAFDDVPMIDALATTDGGRVTVFLVNRDLDAPIDVALEGAGAGAEATSPTATVIAADTPLAINAPVLFNKQLAVRPDDDPIAPTAMATSGWTISLPPCSVTAVEWVA